MLPGSWASVSRRARSWVLTPLVIQPLMAQQPSPPDSVARDTVVRYAHDWRLTAAMGALAVVMVGAPSAFVLSPRAALETDSSMVLPGNSLTAFVTGGGTGTDEPTDWSWSAHLELLRDRFFAALSDEHFDVPRPVAYQTIRAGYLVHPYNSLRGGLTIGYRRASTGENAALIGLPLTMGSHRASMRFEPTYVIAQTGISWTYRLQVEVYLMAPLVVGMVGEAHPLRQGGHYHGTVSLLLGVRR